MHKQSAVVVGAGLMGCDIAAIFLNAGWRVQAVEPGATHRQAARARMQTSVEQLKGRWDESLLLILSSLEEVRWDGVAIVIETVTEKLDIKQQVFAQLDRLVPPQIPIGSNSSGLRITDIAANCATSARMANAHFFLPAHLVPLVELAKGEATSVQTLDQLQAIFRDVGRVAVRINKDLPGFLANRIQHAMMREAFAIIDSGLATPEDVDAAVRFGFGFRYVAAGPILQKELSGLDTQLAAATAIYPSLCNDPEPSRGLRQLVAQGRLGTKSLAGYWTWTPEQVQAERARFEAVLGAAAELLARSPAQLPD